MPWFQQRAGISVAGEGADSHDDFKPVQKDSSAAPSVTEHIEQVFNLLSILQSVSQDFSFRIIVQIFADLWVR